MTRAEVDPGSCGFITRISVERHGNRVEIRISSGCEKVKLFAEAIESLDWTREVLVAMCDSAIYSAATRERLHPGCPVPAAVIRAVEIETGAATPRAVRIEFERD
ncbi:DUF6951 family protein [Candidatus Pyrohabitans sp.]